jgi:sugar lactone lactonase YvrE
VKARQLVISVLFLLPAFLSAQNIDFNAARSADSLRRGVQAFHRGLYNESWTSFEQSVSYQPSNVLALAWLGRAQWKAGYEQEALRTWQQIVASGNGTSLVRDWISVLSFRRGLGRELSGRTVWAVSAELDGSRKGGYPFKRPTSVRPRPDGTFWVVAFGSNEILHYDANFRLLDSLRGGLEGFDRPYDLVEAPDGGFWVSEYGANRIARCNARGEKTAVFGKKGREEGQLLGPQYMAMDERGYLWVTDWGNNRVQRFTADGKFVQAITGVEGPTGVAARDGILYVSSRASRTVNLYDLSGNPVSTIGEGALSDPEGISFAPDGALLVADSNRVLECDVEKETWTVRADTSAHTKRLVQQAVTSNGDMLCADFDQSKVILATDTTSLFAGLVVRVDRVNAEKWPDVFASVSVENRYGNPVMGLGLDNFIITEGHAGVGQPTMAQTNVQVTGFDVTLLVERSPALEAFRRDAEQAAADLYALVNQGGRLKAVSAGEKPTQEADFGETRLRFIRQAFQAAPSQKWKFDLGARLAGDELITTLARSRRAVVLFTSGQFGPAAFSTYSLLEVAAYLRNNDIALYPVVFGPGAPDEDLAWLAAQSGGRLYRSSTPGGMRDVVRDVKARRSSIYTLRYSSMSRPQFGDVYIPVEVEVTVQRVSGREESGYYAPPGTRMPGEKPAAKTEAGAGGE